MPKGIGQRSVAGRAGLGRRQIGARYAAVSYQEPQTFGPGSYTWSPPRAGNWKFVAWGAGGGTSASAGGGGSSGGYGEKTKYLTAPQFVTIVVGGADLVAIGQTTTITFPDGSTLVCAGGGVNGAAAGTSVGGDVNLAGSVGGAIAGSSPAGAGTGGGLGGTANGAGAPANLPYRGGNGGGNVFSDGGSPGAGSKATAINQAGGDGQVIIAFIRD